MIARYSYITAFVCLFVVLACDEPNNPEYGSGNPDPNPPGTAAAILTAFAPDSALPFETVVITGSGFNTEPSANLVSFGPNVANVTSASATQLEVTVPPASGVENIKVAVNGSVDWSNELSGFKFISFFRDLTANEVTIINEDISWPMGVAVDDAGNVFVGSADDGAIYKITPAGDKSTFASVPIVGAIHFGSDGFLYVCERGESKLVRISADGATIEDVADVADVIDFDWDADGNMYLLSHDAGIHILPPGGSISELVEVGGVKNIRVFGDYVYVSKIWDGQINRLEISESGLGDEEVYLEPDTPIAFDFDVNGAMYHSYAWGGSLFLYAPFGAEERVIYEDELPSQSRWMTYHNQEIYMVKSSNGPGSAGVVFKMHIGIDQAPRF